MGGLYVKKLFLRWKIYFFERVFLSLCLKVDPPLFTTVWCKEDFSYQDF